MAIFEISDNSQNIDFEISDGSQTIVFQVQEGQPGASSGFSGLLNVVAGEALGGHRLVVIKGAGAFYASNQEIDHAGALVGITTGAATAGSNVAIQYTGEIQEPGWNWDLVKPIFAGVNGLLTQAAPMPPSLFSQVVAVPITAQKILINVQLPIVI